MEYYPLLDPDSPHLVNHAIILHCVSDRSTCKEFLPNALLIQVRDSFQEFINTIRKVPFDLNASVICYDDGDNDLAGRVWWGLRCIGVLDVWVLNGGLQAWKDAGKTVVKEVRDLHYINKEGYSIRENSLARCYDDIQIQGGNDAVVVANKEFIGLVDENMKLIDKKAIAKFYTARRLTVKEGSRIVCGGDKVGIALISLCRMGYCNLCMIFEKSSLNVAIVPTLQIDTVVRGRASPTSTSFHSVVASEYADAVDQPEEFTNSTLKYYDIPLASERTISSRSKMRDTQGVSSCSRCSLL